jgi:hypothetical protein
MQRCWSLNELPSATHQQSLAVLPSAGTKAATGASGWRVSHTRTPPSRPPVTISGAPQPLACSGFRRGLALAAAPAPWGAAWYGLFALLIAQRLPKLFQHQHHVGRSQARGSWLVLNPHALLPHALRTMNILLPPCPNAAPAQEA